MKKFFTLLAVSALAMGASAQTTATFGAETISGLEKDNDVVCPGFTIAATYFAGGTSKVDVYNGDKGMKLRTNKTDNTLVLTVDAGTAITSLAVGMVTNNDAESITLSGVSIDGVAVADFAAVLLPNTGNADGSAVVNLTNINATESITFSFDDSAYTGKNKQVFVAGEVTYQEAAPLSTYYVVPEEGVEPAFVVTTVGGLKATLGGEKCVDSAGEDNGAAVWNAAKTFSETEVQGVAFPYFVASADNARGADFKGGISPRIYGGFVKFEMTQSGYIYVPFEMPSGKGYYMSEISEANPDGYDLVAAGKATFYTLDGTAVELADGKFADKQKGYMKCGVVAGNTYYFSGNGTKTNFAGFVFEKDSSVGVANIEADESAPVEYYNLQGVRVANPENGIFIRRQGSKATKVLVK